MSEVRTNTRVFVLGTNVSWTVGRSVGRGEAVCRSTDGNTLGASVPIEREEPGASSARPTRARTVHRAPRKIARRAKRYCHSRRRRHRYTCWCCRRLTLRDVLRRKLFYTRPVFLAKKNVLFESGAGRNDPFKGVDVRRQQCNGKLALLIVREIWPVGLSRLCTYLVGLALHRAFDERLTNIERMKATKLPIALKRNRIALKRNRVQPHQSHRVL